METLYSSGWSIFVVFDGKSSSNLRKSKTAPDGCPGPFGVRKRTESLDVEVQGELPGVRAKADRIDLVLSLVLDPGVDGILGEDIAL